MAIRPFIAPVTQKFGVKNSAYRLGFHPGVDYGTKTGTAVKAPESGFVRWLWSNTYGYVAALVRSNGDVIWFAHNSRKGTTGSVKKGTVIAYTGNTGWSTGPHSHVEYRLKGDQNRVIDFEKWLAANPEPKPVYYIVRSGDTMTAIAKKHGLTLTKIKALNPQIKDINKISIGQRVRVK